jgi:hypothetical protein
MVLVAAGPANGFGSVGVAYGANVISSDVGGSVVPAGVDAYNAVQRLYLAGGMPSGSKIIMFGWGLTGDYPDLSDLIDLGYYTRGFAFFSPAGSAVGGWSVVFPANKSEVFAVTARSSMMVPHPSAHLGPEVDGVAFAPVFVSGTTANPLSSINVTSAATAQVAGVAALVLERYPSLSNAQLYSRLKMTAREYCGPTFGSAWQIVNAEAAVGGLCVPEGQFHEVTYTIYPDGPQTITHTYCLSYSGGISPSVTILHPVPHPTNPLCGSVTTGPQEGSEPGYISIPVSIQDLYAPNNPPITNYFRIKIVKWSCPPENPSCI